jgi:hypothetical protein
MAPSFVMTNYSVSDGITPSLVLQKHTQQFRHTVVNSRLKKCAAAEIVPQLGYHLANLQRDFDRMIDPLGRLTQVEPICKLRP